MRSGRVFDHRDDPVSSSFFVGMFRSKEASSYLSGRGASSRSNKSDNTLLTPLLDDSISDSDSDDSDDSSTAASYEGVPEVKPSPFQLMKLAVGE